MVDGSRWSWQSRRSILSIGSEDSVLAFQANGTMLGRRSRGPLHGPALPLAIVVLNVALTAVRLRSMLHAGGRSRA